jgi:DNA-binding transcriptional MerR regulator
MTDKLYYKIGEVCELTELKPSILRFWEKEFKQLRPVKSGGGQRFYTKKHLELIELIKQMLYVDKLTIEGARIRLSRLSDEPPHDNSALSADEIKSELLDILRILEN